MIVAYFLLAWGTTMNTINSDAKFKTIFEEQPGWFHEVLQQSERYQVQIRYTQIDRDVEQKPHFTTFTLGDASRYFYPASSIKLFAAIAALEKLNTPEFEHVDRGTVLKIQAIRPSQTSVDLDEGRPATIEQYIRKLFVVSDNDAFNRLYEFCGQAHLNQRLSAVGLKDTLILHRLSVFLSPEENRHTNPFTFFRGEVPILHQDAQFNSIDLIKDRKPIPLGKGYMSDEKLVQEPMDFGLKNITTLEDLQGTLQRLIFPEAFPVSERFHLNEGDYQFLYRMMAMLPRECEWPLYRDPEHVDGYGKFFLFGTSQERMPESIRILNKTGEAFGFQTDNAYIVDREKGVEFFLSAVIFVNDNAIFNDDTYEYDTTGLPFLTELGRAVYQYEVGRKREVKPDLSCLEVAF